MERMKTPLKTASNSEITLWEIVSLFLSKFHWLLISGAVFSLVVYLFVNFLVTPEYESRVSFYVYNRSGAVSNAGTINRSDLEAAESLAATYSEILGSNSVLDSVLNDFGTERCLTRKELSEMLNISAVSDTQLLEVVVKSADAQFAFEIADSFARVAPTEIVRITKAGGVEVVDYPEVALEKASPKTVLDTVVGFIVGAIIASVFLILKIFSDTAIYLPEDIESLTGIAVLGAIPEIEIPTVKYNYWNIVEGGVLRYGNKEGKATGAE